MKEKEIEMLKVRAELFWKRIRKMILTDSTPFNAKIAKTPEMLKFQEAKKLKFKEIKEGDSWGKAWDCAWFELNAVVPKNWAGKEVVAQIELTGEGLIFNSAGEPIQSITNGSVFEVDYSKDLCYLLKKCKGEEKIQLWVEAVGNHLFGVNRHPDAAQDDPDRHGTFNAVANKMRLCVFNREIYDLWLDLEIAIGLIKTKDIHKVQQLRILEAVNNAIDVFAENPCNAGKTRDIIKKELSRKATDLDLTTYAVGHAHIDTGWLWRVKEGIRKCGRTFASQITLLEKYNDYVFGASQAQHYEFTKLHYPEIYEKIKDYVKKGRWEIQGAMWVEADCNITSGESLIRQVLHGKNFFMDEFGVDVKNLWLPDVFGYSAALPQILKKSGVDFFVTQKLCWSQFNQFPHTTFIWKGIDGSEVISHFPPENTYNANLRPESLIFARNNFKESSYIDEFLTLFGIGDGGGGPKEEYIERGIRLSNLYGVPKVKFGRAQDFLEKLRKYKDKLPKWVGELYLEVHRGTYTTQARVKKGNRKLEQKLKMTEFICSCAPIEKYPIKELDRIWKTLLVNQFHDILPGSSIHGVYQDTWQQHEECLKKCDQLIEKAANQILKKDSNSITFVNCLSNEFKGVVELPEDFKNCLQTEDGQKINVQLENDRAVAKIAIPPHSYLTLKKSGNAEIAEIQKGKSLQLENSLIKCQFNNDGTIKSLYDKEYKKELIHEGKKANLFTLYTDIPNNWDAWDIDFHYEKSIVAHAELLNSESLPSGNVRQGIKLNFKIGSSTIEQEVWLTSDSKRLDFKTKIDWKEKHKMLRVSFPTNIESDYATFEIQYGYMRRPTHRNTSWDFAKFESVAHRYVDISDQNYGIALLNDCKYGHKVLDNVIDLNLLRSPTEPDPDADMGIHEFTYSLLPHKGSFVESDVISEAASLNMPPVIFDGFSAENIKVPVSIYSEGNSVSMEVLKRAEKEDSLVIRLVELKGCESVAELEFSNKNAKLIECDIMEWNDFGKKINCSEKVKIQMKPFEIKTFKLKN
ncbi:MAG TPA: glycoside hydrolase family 38 C-terminal domain-containing protein [Victivallales bacterium]|nr:glycoside hydrolase family 38 C-terminal domain-containing protein [Victivallales bacterium]HPO89562.1 glycoside hydrolase family 38 C-terminal domain-containing protein [Victivallales bacterium]